MLAIIVSVFIVAGLGHGQTIIDGPSLGCNLFEFEHHIEQTDSQGKRCWGNVVVLSCRGRCDSREISYWKFPHKKAFHPVCLHVSRDTYTSHSCTNVCSLCRVKKLRALFVYQIAIAVRSLVRKCMNSLRHSRVDAKYVRRKK